MYTTPITQVQHRVVFGLQAPLRFIQFSQLSNTNTRPSTGFLRLTSVGSSLTAAVSLIPYVTPLHYTPPTRYHTPMPATDILL
ncbi:hypothetical protein BD311DRAFT_746293, partial [Dichomitus squalens]